MREVEYARRKRGKRKGLILGLLLVCCVEGLATAVAGMRRTPYADPCDTLQEVRRKSQYMRKELLLQEIQRGNEDLRRELKKTPWPKLKYFSTSGLTYSLPLRAESRGPSHRPAEARLEYLAGFFDGDGCVSFVWNLSGCRLVVWQSFDQAEVLMHFREAFGGSIGRKSEGRGLKKPMLQWLAFGDSARRAAELLAPHSITKQKQLLLAALWPETQSEREDCKAELHALKKCDSAVAGSCSWSYFAGFFDAEGYIKQRTGGVSLQLRVSHKHPRVLLTIRDFLATTSTIDATVGRLGKCAHQLIVSGLSNCKQILQDLLDSGLLCKSEQAQLALSLSPENAAKVSAELAGLTGNQQFGKRLNAAGQERARKIRSAQTQAAWLRRRGLHTEVEVKQRGITKLKQEHQLLKARCENQQLLEYLCKLQSLHENSWEGPLAPGM